MLSALDAASRLVVQFSEKSKLIVRWGRKVMGHDVKPTR